MRSSDQKYKAGLVGLLENRIRQGKLKKYVGKLERNWSLIHNYSYGSSGFQHVEVDVVSISLQVISARCIVLEGISLLLHVIYGLNVASG